MSYIDRKMDQLDAIQTQRVQREWREAGKVQQALAARIGALPIALPTRKEDAEESKPSALAYVAWITPHGRTPQRVDIDPVLSKEEAIKSARLAGSAIAARAGVERFDVMVRPA